MVLGQLRLTLSHTSHLRAHTHTLLNPCCDVWRYLTRLRAIHCQASGNVAWPWSHLVLEAWGTHILNHAAMPPLLIACGPVRPCRGHCQPKCLWPPIICSSRFFLVPIHKIRSVPYDLEAFTIQSSWVDGQCPISVLFLLVALITPAST